MKYKVTFKEKGKAPQERWCDVPTEQEIVNIYGLNEEDIEYYKIETL